MKTSKTKYYSWKKGRLAKGCRLCVKGEKSVFFITGKCSNNCFYCPISDAKKNKDITYINEWPTSKKKEIISEIKLCRSKGVGITGGDPLCSFSRTLKWIKILKKEFGKDFHIHLYTPLNLVSEERLKKLYDAGLDEIRFHPSLSDKKLWDRINLAKSYDWDVGIEIPAIPKYEEITSELIDSADVDFININELEMADNEFSDFSGYKTKDSLSYAVKGSQKMALDLMKKVNGNAHFCTAKLKDKVQMTERIKRRAESIKLDTDLISDQGTLIRGVVYPGKNKLSGKGFKKVFVDKKKKRLIVDIQELMKKKDDLKEKGYTPAIVEEYPTYDGFEVEVDLL